MIKHCFSLRPVFVAVLLGLLAFQLAASRPAEAQGQWRTELTPCDQNGGPISGFDANGHPYHGQMTDGILTGSGDGKQSIPAQNFGYVYSPSPNDWERKTGTALYSWQYNDNLTAGFGTNADSSFYGPNSDDPFHTSSSGSANVHFSLSAHYLWQTWWDDEDTGTPAPATGQPTPPPSERFLLQTQLIASSENAYVGNGWGGVSASDYTGLYSSCSLTDMFGETVSAFTPTAPDPHSGGYNYQTAKQNGGGNHLVSAPLKMINGKAIYTVTLTGDGTASSTASISTDSLNGNASTTVSLDGIVTQDNCTVTLHRDGAHGETHDPDGTVHGDTIYSYGDYIVTEDTGQEKRADYLNWQTFHPNFAGNRKFSPESTPYWAWTPSESDDTSDTGKVSMHYRDYFTQEGDPRGTDDAPETRMVSYSATDPLGATVTANYILTVHDPNEVGPDTVTRGIENLRMAPNAAYGRSTADGSPVTVYAEQSDSWSLGITSDIPWILPKLNLNASASYTYSYNAGVQCVLPSVRAGYGTYLEEFDSYKYHTGIITQWDAGGYVGTKSYHVKEPDRPSGGYQAHTPAIPLPGGGIH